MRCFNKLVNHFLKISYFNHLISICTWDQSVMMSSTGYLNRSHALAELKLHIYDLQNKPELMDWYENSKLEKLTLEEQITLKEMNRSWINDKIIPLDLIKAKTLAISKCEYNWRTQRVDNDWKGFVINFKEVVKLIQEESKIRAENSNLSYYEAMLNLYEPGITINTLNSLFNNIKTWLPNMVTEIIAKQKKESIINIGNYFPIYKQKKLSLYIMKLLNFDFTRGRIDVSIHPFCGGVPSDVRITTRYNKNNFISSVMNVIHETGHAVYEQGLPKHLMNLPSGIARSMGIHESQSLFFEMHIGRNKEFLRLIYFFLHNLFGKKDSLSVNNLFKIYTKVKPGYIRIEADEVTYPIHIIIRYEIERDLINEVISFNDIPEIWNDKMQKYLGLSIKDNFKDGCMQDIHWPWGMFGYFPSYTLGSIYAAQFKFAMMKSLNFDKAITSKKLFLIFDWLSKNIWKKASLLSTDELMIQATGEKLNINFYKQHLKERYLLNVN